MNSTQVITMGWLQQSALVGDELLLEALLRRGFLACRDDQGIWLGTGSHSADPKILSFIRGLALKPVANHKDQVARLKLRSNRVSAKEVATSIVNLPDDRRWASGLGGLRKSGWTQYRNMVWGAKLPACGAPESYDWRKDEGRLGMELDAGAPDMGVALLVKTLPLARVATSVCCDGHGVHAANISFFFQWDGSWGKAVFDVLAGKLPNSTWHWGSDLRIEPHGRYGDVEVMNMLNDIQCFSRQLMNQEFIEKIGRARAKTLDVFGAYPPTAECFLMEARHQLAQEFV